MLIGLSGKAGSGKSTATRYLIDKGFEQRKFAGPLKDMLRALLRSQGVDEAVLEEYIEGRLKELPTDYLGGRTPRHAMQTLGTEWGRLHMGVDFWVDSALKGIEYGTSDNLIYDDCRFWNEALAIRQRGGIVVSIIRPELAGDMEHESEHALKDFDFNYVIYNEGTLNALHDKLDTLMRWIEQYEKGSQ